MACLLMYVYRIAISLALVSTLALAAWPRELTLDEAITLAVTRTGRAEIIRGNLEVAESNYFAERVNFYVPEISLNGSLPAYSFNESFRGWGGLDQNELIKTRDFDFTTNIELTQSLLTGGDLTVRGNVVNSDTRYPSRRDLEVTINENTRQGFFDFEFEQPFLKPSEAKNDLNNARDDLELARLTELEDITSLKKEVIEAYFGVLQLSLGTELTRVKLESTRLKAEVDSAKFRDGVISEEAWLESASARLDAELEQFDVDNQRRERNRDLAILLDFDASEAITPSVPELAGHLDETEKEKLVRRWEKSVDVRKAQHEYRKEQRAADYAASAHGLNGNLAARYSLGLGQVDRAGQQNEDFKTNSWEVSLNLSYPIWDGGASGAAVKAARLVEQKAKIKYERTKRSARAQIVNLINRLDVGYRMLEVLRQQINIIKNKLDIAEFRLGDGQISMITYIESKIDYLEARNKYLEELKNYLFDRVTLEGKV